MEICPDITTKPFGGCVPGELLWSPHDPFEPALVVAGEGQNFRMPIGGPTLKFGHILGCRDETIVASLGTNYLLHLGSGLID